MAQTTKSTVQKNTIDVEKLEKEIKTLEEALEMSSALEKLKKDKNFKKVIYDGFLGKYVEEIMNAGMSTEVNIPAEAITTSLKSVRELDLYLNRILLSKSNVTKLLEDAKKLLKQTR